MSTQRAHSRVRSSRPADRPARAIVDALREARPAPHGPEPGHVRGRGRQRLHDAALRPRARHRHGRGAARVHPRRLALALVHRALRQLRRGDGRGARQGAGRRAAQGAPGRRGQAARARPRPRRDVVEDGRRRRRCARATSCSSRPATRSPATARSSRASPPSTRAPSPARARRSSARAAAIAAPSPAARACSPTGSSCASRANPGETFLDRMIAMVEGAKRQKTPNEIALDILLAALTIVFLLATVTLLPFSLYAVRAAGQGAPVTLTVLVALLVCLIPTTIGGLLSAIGIAGMDRMIQANVIATSGRAVEAAGDVDVLLLDKTGTITLGNRQATRVPAGARRAPSASSPTRRSSPRSPTRRPRGAASWCSPRRSSASAGATCRRSGRDVRPVHRADADERRGPRRARRSARAPPTPSRASSRSRAAAVPAEVRADRRARSRKQGATPLVVADGGAGARRRAAQGHRQGRHPGALRASCAAWGSRP